MYNIIFFVLILFISMLYMTSIMALRDTRTTYLSSIVSISSTDNDGDDVGVNMDEYTNAERLIAAITRAQLYGKTKEESITIVRSIMAAIYKEASLTTQMENEIILLIRSITPDTNHAIIDACLEIIEMKPDIDKSLIHEKLMDMCIQSSY